MRITETSAYKSADKIIGDALRRRGSESDDYHVRPLQETGFGIPMYALRLCRRLHAIIGREDVSLRDVVMADTCASGHVDYHRKFALYCAELAEYGKMVGRL